MITNKKPTFKCNNTSRDLFTVSNTFGNKALTYPIGLATADETLYAGIVDSKLGNNNYLQSDTWNWTMTPFYYDGVGITYTYGGRDASSLLTNIISGYYVRPVINLKANVKITGGIGTTNNPFVIETGEKY